MWWWRNERHPEQSPSPARPSLPGSPAATYARPNFGLAATTPDDWSVYRERGDKGALILGFGLPKVWSEIEKQDIENSVSITALRRPDIRSVQDHIARNNERLADILVSQSEAES